MNYTEASLLRLRKFLEDIRDHANLAGTSSGQSLDGALAEVRLLIDGGSLPTVGGHVVAERGTYQAIAEIGIARSLITFVVRDSDFYRPRELLRVENPCRIGDLWP